MGTYWFTSDWHLDHPLIVELRGFASAAEHNEAILTAHNEAVAPGDVVFNLGDFMLPYKAERATEFLRSMNGTQQLIIGNHDPGKLVKHKEWAWTGHIRGRKIDDTAFFLCHYSCRSWPGMGKGSIHLYGHSHGNLAPGYGRSMDVGVDTRSDWGPWNIEEVRELLTEVEPLIVDHHGPNEGEESVEDEG